MGGARTGGSKVADASLNVVPTIDLLICLICFLVVSSVWTSLSKIDVEQALPRTKQVDAAKPPTERARIHVAVTSQGFAVNMTGAEPTLATPTDIVLRANPISICRGRRAADGRCLGLTDTLKRYDHDKLSDELVRLAKASPEGFGTRIMVAMNDEVPYAHLIGAMDTVLGACEPKSRACLANVSVGDMALLKAQWRGGR